MSLLSDAVNRVAWTRVFYQLDWFDHQNFAIACRLFASIAREHDETKRKQARYRTIYGRTILEGNGNIPDGPCTHFTEDGQLVIQHYYERGLRHGTYEQFDSRGKLVLQANFTRGLVQSGWQTTSNDDLSYWQTLFDAKSDNCNNQQFFPIHDGEIGQPSFIYQTEHQVISSALSTGCR